MTGWVASQLGPAVPVHFAALPRVSAREAGPALRRAREAAAANGLRYAYFESPGQAQATECHVCGATLVVRDGEKITEWAMSDDGGCRCCGVACAGVFEGHPARVAAEAAPVVPA
jgi:pyruvate formate lyase activating enzyme